MGDAFIVRRNNSRKLFAVISVTYPNGSTCICSNGSKTLTAKGTSGSYIFYVPEAGTWTVSCTDGTKTKSQNVVISTEYQSESVLLTYELYVYNRGVEGVSLSTHHVGGGSVTKGTSNITITTYAEYGWTTENGVYTTDPVDLTPYTKLTVRAKRSGSHATYLRVKKNGTVISSKTISNSSSETDYELSVSELMDGYTVEVFAEGGHGSGGSSESKTIVYIILLS